MFAKNRLPFASSLLAILLFPFTPAVAALAAPQCGGHGHSGHEPSDHSKAQETRIGDPYLLDVDAVSGKKLGPIETQVIRLEHGREFRFASKETADQFSADPAQYIPGIDAKIVEQQKPFYPLETCLVSGEKLDPKAGAVDLVWANRLIRLSNRAHEKAFLADPAKFAAQLDAAVIEQQKPAYKLATCVVSGEKLGGEMGDPIDYVVGNRLVRFCCKSCLKDFNKDPLKYLGQLEGRGKPDAGAKGSSEKSVSYTCPMHPDVVQSSPGRCPKCGMDLVKKK